MSREVATTRPEVPLPEAIQLMREVQHGALPVLGAGGQVQGMISATRIMTQCLPEYVLSIGDTYSVGDWAPFDERVRELVRWTVGDLMDPKAPLAGPDTPLAELAALMVIHGVQHIPIIEQGQLVGIVAVQDVIDSIGAHPWSSGQRP